MMSEDRIAAYGGELVDLILSPEESLSLKERANDMPAVVLNQRQLCDLEMLSCGAFSPLTGFMDEIDYRAVLDSSMLNSGLLWPVPFTLDLNKSQLDQIGDSAQISLCDAEGFVLAVMDVSSVWKPDKVLEAHRIYGTDDINHPGVRYLFNNSGEFYVGGKIQAIQLHIHYDFEGLRNSPRDLRHLFSKNGWKKIVAFHTSKAMHRVHYDITMNAAKRIGANILIHPVAGIAKPGDLAYYSRVHCYQAIQKYYPKSFSMVSLLPMAMRMAGPREAIQNMIIRQNYGCTHFIVGPEHASPPGVRAGSRRFYESYSAQTMIKSFQDKLDIQMVPIQELVYSAQRQRYVLKSEVVSEKTKDYSENDLNLDLEQGCTVPDWYTFPEVVAELSKVKLSRKKKGFTLFFTGLSGSGKSTLAKLVYARFIEQGGRPVTLLDGDVVRTNLSSELGFSKEHRDLNVKRIGFVASEITKNRGIAICAPIAPYREVRRSVREVVEGQGAFIEIHVSTPLEVCEKRDRKGLYAKARKGIIKNFTGISDPYEIPEAPEIRIDTSFLKPIEAVQEIMLYLFKEGYLDLC